MLQEFDVEMMSMERLKERRADLIRVKENARKVRCRCQCVNLLPPVQFSHKPDGIGVSDIPLW